MISLKILGALDIIAGILLWLNVPFSIPAVVLGAFGVYVLAKGLIFVGFGLDKLSIADIIAGAVIIASAALTLPTMIIAIVSFYLIIKGSVSLL